MSTPEATRASSLDKLRGALSELRHFPRAARLIHQATGRWLLGWCVLLVARGLLPLAQVHLLGAVVDALVGVLDESGAWSDLLVPIGLFAVVLALSEALAAGTGWVEAVQAELLDDHVTGLIHERAIRADFAFYEWPEFHDHLHRAREEARYRPMSLLANAGSLLQSAITLVAMTAVLIPFGVSLGLALLISTLPALWITLRHGIAEVELRRRRTTDQRRLEYQDWILTSRDAAAEVRLFALGDHFRSAYRQLRAGIRRERLDLVKRRSIAQFVSAAFGLAVTAGALLVVVGRVAAGNGTLGDLARFYQAFHQGQSMMRMLLTHLASIYADVLFLGNLFAFLDFEPRLLGPTEPATLPEPLRDGLRFRAVTFAYPGSDRAVLRDLDLFVPAGRMAAVVGTNGAGKSTVLKLICRFYDPDTGSIEIDGLDLRSLSLEDLRRRIAVLFQGAVRYGETAETNVALGDLRAAPSRDAVETAARAAGADQVIEALPNGYSQLLGIWLPGGTDLSVGEWQRVALARALMKGASVLLLDEPTSAMDSWAEGEWLRRLRDVTRDRTTLVITHRFTTARRADVIFVMRDGHVVESGSHDDLIERDGEYARSWRQQVGEASPQPAREPGSVAPSGPFR